MPRFLPTPAQLLHLLLISLFSSIVLANVDKTIFLAPSSSRSAKEDLIKDAGDQQAERWLDIKLQHIHTLIPDPTDDRSSLRTRLNRVFPSAHYPQGQDAWFLLEGLTEGQRYEVRVCWAATQPTNFYMETHTPTEVLTTPHLAGSLMEYFPAVSPKALHVARSKDLGSSLLLQVSAAADYFTSNASLMLHPPPVDVDIILDPFLFNVLPRSLVPTIGWIVVVAVAGWLVSKRVVSFLVGEVVSSEEASEGVEETESKKVR
ncbi:hypothetical protein QBC45DRAFT_210153 [Copromyces sp. CBS 386.78]|nr:hypothetical protein QBC45DRAFT_210153 [Copromyces sp. CBS 386.78]